jgi:hypothetical protein
MCVCGKVKGYFFTETYQSETDGIAKIEYRLIPCTASFRINKCRIRIRTLIESQTKVEHFSLA